MEPWILFSSPLIFFNNCLSIYNVEEFRIYLIYTSRVPLVYFPIIKDHTLIHNFIKACSFVTIKSVESIYMSIYSSTNWAMRRKLREDWQCLKLENKRIKNKSVFAILIKHFYSQVMNIFVEALNKKLWGKSFFVIKPKLFWRIEDFFRW